MSEDNIPNVLQDALRMLCRIIGEIDEFLASTGDDPIFRASFLADLGLPVNALDDPAVADQLKSPCDGRLRDFIEAKDPDLQAFESVMQDIQAYIDAWGAVIKAALAEDSGLVLDQIVNQLFQLATLNYLKYRHPFVYYWARFVGFIYYEYQVQFLERVDFHRLVRLADDPKGYWHQRLAELAALYDDVRLAGVPQAPLIGSCEAQKPPDLDPAIAAQVGRGVFAWSDLFFPLTQLLAAKYGPVLDTYYGWEADPNSTTPIADRISNRLLTISLGNEVDDDASASVQGQAVFTLALVPDETGLRGLWVALGGDLEVKRQAGDGPSPWAVTATISAGEPFNLLASQEEWSLTGPETGALEIELERKPAAPGPVAVLPATTGTRLEFGSLKATLDLDKDGFKAEFEARDSALVIASRDGDFFTSKALAEREYRLDFNLGLGLDNEHGLYLKGGAGFSATIPIGKTIGPARVQTLHLGVTLVPQGDYAQVEAAVAATMALKLGALTATVAGLGFSIGLAIARPAGSLPDSAKPLVPFLGYTGLGFKPPNGIGLVVDSTGVTGGGFLFHDKTSGQYAGVLQLQIGDLTLSAAGLISRLPESSLGYSLLVTGSLRGLDWEIGLGFRITGLGVLVGANRTANVDALRVGLKNGTLDLILFPAHPVADAPRIVSALATVFPPAAGQFMVGLAARLEWGTKVDAAANLEVIVEGPSPWRILILGQLSIRFPPAQTTKKAVVCLNLDALGVIDLDRGELALDATLHDSTILDLAVSGDMALRLRWKGQRAFLLAIGGFHPRFTPPPGFPSLQRITFAMNELDGSLSLRFTAYLAVTSNSLQLGADLQVHLGFLGFSIDGELGFDVLLQREAPELTAGLHGSVALRFLGETFAAAGFDATYTGWHPQQHVEGEVTFKVWIFSKSKHFSKSFGKSEPPPQLPAVDPLPDLLAALADPRNWQARLPAGQPALVSLRDGIGPGLVHPRGTLAVRQEVVPLDIDIDRYGPGRPTGAHRFTIDGVTLQGVAQDTTPVTDFFAAGQFLDLSDDEQLTRPSFEPMTAGISLGGSGLTFGGQATGTEGLAASTTLDYETCILAPGGGCVREPAPHRPPMASTTLMAEVGAAARSPLRTTGSARFASSGRPVTVQPPRFAIAGLESLVAPTGGPAATASFTEATQALRRQQGANPALAGGLHVLAAFLVREEES